MIENRAYDFNALLREARNRTKQLPIKKLYNGFISDMDIPYESLESFAKENEDIIVKRMNKTRLERVDKVTKATNLLIPGITKHEKSISVYVEVDDGKLVEVEDDDSKDQIIVYVKVLEDKFDTELIEVEAKEALEGSTLKNAGVILDVKDKEPKVVKESVVEEEKESVLLEPKENNSDVNKESTMEKVEESVVEELKECVVEEEKESVLLDSKENVIEINKENMDDEKESVIEEVIGNSKYVSTEEEIILEDINLKEHEVKKEDLNINPMLLVKSDIIGENLIASDNMSYYEKRAELKKSENLNTEDLSLLHKELVKKPLQNTEFEQSIRSIFSNLMSSPSDCCGYKNCLYITDLINSLFRLRRE